MHGTTPAAVVRCRRSAPFPMLGLVLAAVLLASAAQAQPSTAPRATLVRKTQADLVVGAVAARELPATLRAVARPGLTEVVTLLRANRVDEARARWAEVVPATGLRSPVDVNALVQWVLRESYLESTQDLKDAADKVRYFNEMKKAMRDDLGRARAGRAVSGLAVEPYRPGGAAVRAEPLRTPSAIERDRYVQRLQESLNRMGQDDQLANVDLQNAMQRQQQTLQMMANVSKMLHDTATAVIRKMGG